MTQISDINATQIARNINGILIAECVTKIAGLAMGQMNINVFLAMIGTMIFILQEQDALRNVEMENRWAIMSVMMET